MAFSRGAACSSGPAGVIAGNESIPRAERASARGPRGSSRARSPKQRPGTALLPTACPGVPKAKEAALSVAGSRAASEAHDADHVPSDNYETNAGNAGMERTRNEVHTQ